MTRQIYHISGWKRLSTASAGDEFTLVPGPQCAEGTGVYFSEGCPRWSAAEGTQGVGASAVVVLTATTSKGWWRSKGSAYKKAGRPRSWHSSGKSVRCTVQRTEVVDGVKYLVCDFTFIDPA